MVSKKQNHPAFCLDEGRERADLGLWKHRLDLEYGSEITSVPPQVAVEMSIEPTPTSMVRHIHVPPKCSFHTSIQSEDTVLAHDLPHDVDGAAISTRQGLVL